jgi:alpha-tubulin suppressor-like RCC1 family protein
VYDLPLEEAYTVLSSSSTTAQPKRKKAKVSADAGDTASGSGGVLLQSGTLDSRVVGRKTPAGAGVYHLNVPTRLLPGIPIVHVFTSCSAAHSVAIDIHQQTYGWGRNELGALGPHLPDTVAYPTALSDLPVKVRAAALGKSHTIWWMVDGSLYASGANKSGQCGVKTFADVNSYRKCVLPDACTVVQVRRYTCLIFMSIITHVYLITHVLHFDRLHVVKIIQSCWITKDTCIRLDHPSTENLETARLANISLQPANLVLQIAMSLPSAQPFVMHLMKSYTPTVK